MPEEKDNTSNTVEELRDAIVDLTHRVVKELSTRPASQAGVSVLHEAIRCAGEAGLLYRQACKAKSRADFYAALPEVADAIEDAIYWLNLAHETGVLPDETATPLLKSARETHARFTAARLSETRRGNRGVR